MEGIRNGYGTKTEEEISKEGLDKLTNIEEKKWMIKLRCFDEEHSNLYGLTLKAFEDLAFQVESQIEPIRPRICSHDEIVQCLKRNASCSIRCRPIMERYIDCIETFRVNIIKEQIECELKEKRKEDQKIVEHFLKNDSPSQYN
ncbi:uncharacterized protein LOC115879613 isoform X2 [Sitophilus oryzae]|uniref:Uncharacterized protein LOC115879613 isoform X2 n=1 Tax=Sitophilus oryzae TaxID=7048 RepID=A0A6J2XNZ1_SITOR|nr:uncharacterized protein LOC115879613 isoform X2 [Sitophilus oryzae]